MCNLVMVIGPHLVCIEWLLPLLPWVGGSLLLLIQGSSFPGLVPSDDVVDSESVMGIKPGDSGVVIGYQVDECTCTWSAEWVVAHSHIYPEFTGKVSSLTHYPLEPGFEDYAFLDQAVTDFKQGLDSILTDSLMTPELDTFLEEPDAITSSSVSSGFLHSVPFLIITSCSLLLAFILINCGARLGLFLPLCLWLPRCQYLNWSIMFLATLQPLDSRPPLHQITSPWILPTGKHDQSLSDFQTGVGAAAYATLSHRATHFSSPGLPLLILFPHCPRLREMLYLCLKCMNYFSGFKAFWTRLFPSEFETQHIF